MHYKPHKQETIQSGLSPSDLNQLILLSFVLIPHGLNNIVDVEWEQKVVGMYVSSYLNSHWVRSSHSVVIECDSHFELVRLAALLSSQLAPFLSVRKYFNVFRWMLMTKWKIYQLIGTKGFLCTRQSVSFDRLWSMNSKSFQIANGIFMLPTFDSRWL